MTAYFYSPYGNDLWDGQGPNYNGAKSGPWLTPGKAVHAGTPVVGGDTVWGAPNVYYNVALVPIAGIASSGSPLALRGDYSNSQGFRDRNNALILPGDVWLTVRTAAEGLDSDVASGSILLTGSTNGTDGFQWYDMVLEAGMQNNHCVRLAYNTNADWLFQRCFLIGTSIINYSGGAPTAARNLTVRGCTLWGPALNAAGTTAAATADADLNILFESNFILGRMGFNVQLGAVAGLLAGGVRYRFNRVIVAGNSTINLSTVAGGVSTVMPIRVEGNVVLGGGAAVSAGTLGHVVSDGANRFISFLTSANFTLGATDKNNTAPQFAFPHRHLWGLSMPSEDVLGWTADAPAVVLHSASTNTSVDYRNRTPRPWGTGPTIGPFEVPLLAQDMSSQITGGGATSLAIMGAGEVSVSVQVDAVAVTLTIVTKSSGYGGTNYPQVVMQANTAIGVVATTATATDATQQTLTIGPFTPTASGVVELRLMSRSVGTSGQTFFDLLQAA